MAVVVQRFMAAVLKQSTAVVVQRFMAAVLKQSTAVVVQRFMAVVLKRFMEVVHNIIYSQAQSNRSILLTVRLYQ
jgi:hypothetical protein